MEILRLRKRRWAVTTSRFQWIHMTMKMKKKFSLSSTSMQQCASPRSWFGLHGEAENEQFTSWLWWIYWFAKRSDLKRSRRSARVIVFIALFGDFTLSRFLGNQNESSFRRWVRWPIGKNRPWRKWSIQKKENRRIKLQIAPLSSGLHRKLTFT